MATEHKAPLTQIKVSAPGKVILFGEHSVVYNKLAVAASLGLRTTVTIYDNCSGNFLVNFENTYLKENNNIEYLRKQIEGMTVPFRSEQYEETKERWKQPKLIDHSSFIDLLNQHLKLQRIKNDNNRLSMLAFYYLYLGIVGEFNPLTVNIKTELSIGSGTGSSASLMVSLTGAFIQYLKNKEGKPSEQFNDEELNIISQWAFNAEKIFHGNPSGIDNAVCTYGSMVSFRKGRAPFHIKTANNINCLLVDTKVPKNTKIMVQKVATLHEKHEIIVDAVLDCMDKICTEAVEYLIQMGEFEKSGMLIESKKCQENLSELVRINHSMLCGLGVSCLQLDDVVHTLYRSGINGKITGAGGGGYAIALIFDKTEEELRGPMRMLYNKAYKTNFLKLGGPGVTVDDF